MSRPARTQRIFQRIARTSHWYEARLTPLGHLFAGLLVGAAIFSSDPSRSQASFLLAGLAALFVIALVFCVSWHPPLAARRTLPARAIVGRETVYRILLENNGDAAEHAVLIRDRLREQFADQHPASGLDPSPLKRDNWFDRQTGFRRWSRRTQWLRGALLPSAYAPIITRTAPHESIIRFVPLRRGLIEFSGIELARADPLGLCYGIHPIATVQQLLVLPRQHPVPGLTLLCANLARLMPQSGVPSLTGAQEFHALREYRPGDSFRQIHWRASAKRGVHVVRQALDPAPLACTLIVDSCTSPERFEALIEVVASLLAAAATAVPDSLALRWLGPQPTAPEAGIGAQPVALLLDTLALAKPTIADHFDAATPHLEVPQVSSAIFITANWASNRRVFSDRLSRFHRAPAHTIVVTEDALEINDLPARGCIIRGQQIAHDLAACRFTGRRA